MSDRTGNDAGDRAEPAMGLRSLNVRALRVPIWREARVTREGAGLCRSGSDLDRDLPRGDGSAVLLIPGYLAGDRSLAPLANWLRRIGYAPERAAITNVNCLTRTTDRLVARLTAITEAQGDRAIVVGHSLGGVIGRVLATRHPELVRGVVTLGAPLVDVNAVHPLVWVNVRLLTALGDLGVPGVISRGCLSGECCAASRRLLREPLPQGVEFVSLYSRSDGIVDWRSCLAPGAAHVEVDSSHIGMPVNAAVYRVLAERLADLGYGRPPLELRAAA
jgi:pimeloyl-ACP methyl ester carboxylesterase